MYVQECLCGRKVMVGIDVSVKTDRSGEDVLGGNGSG